MEKRIYLDGADFALTFVPSSIRERLVIGGCVSTHYMATSGRRVTVSELVQNMHWKVRLHAIGLQGQLFWTIHTASSI